MNNGSAIWQLREALRPEIDDEDQAIDRIREKVRSGVRRQALQPGSRRTSRSRLRVVASVAAAVAVLVTGIATAADQGLLFSDEPTTDRIDAVQPDSAAPSVPLAESNTYSPLHWPLTSTDRNELDRGGAKELLRFSADRVQVRLVAVPTASKDLCYAIAAGPSGDTESFKGQSCSKFRPGWPLIESSGSTGEGFQLHYGIAANEVEAVTFLTAGERHDARLENNAYVWIAPEAEPRPDAIEVRFVDGSIARRGLSSDSMGYGAFQDPVVIKRGSAS